MDNPSTYSDLPLVQAVIEGLEDKKGQKICLMDMRHLPERMADFFVIAQAESSTQLRALAESVNEKVREQLGLKPWGTEGQTHGRWILMDYAELVVHLFIPELREYYHLEKLWNDARITFPEPTNIASNS
jgi:ribosome-associated protein